MVYCLLPSKKADGKIVGPGGPQAGGVWRSADRGETWESAMGDGIRLQAGGNMDQFQFLAMAQTSPDTVYVTDRANNRVQAFTLDGKFLKEGFIKRDSKGTGTAFRVAFSADPEQRFVYIADGSNERIAILERASLEEIGHIGGPGRKAGEFFHRHSLDVDPQGNIVTGESQGYRVQKFIFKGLTARGRSKIIRGQTPLAPIFDQEP